MAANWTVFINNFSNYLQSVRSTGPADTGSTLAKYYLDAISSSQAAPVGNSFSSIAVSPPISKTLEEVFGQAFIDLSKSNITVEEKRKDPKFKKEENPKFPDTNSTSDPLQEEFRKKLRTGYSNYKFRFFELSSPESEFVLEIDPSKREELFRKRGASIRNNDKLYLDERAIYENLYKNFIEEKLNPKATQSQTPDEDPYDMMAKGIITFWVSIGIGQTFSSLPPVPPATEPVPGLFTILYPGDPKNLADGIRRAFNIGIDPNFAEGKTIDQQRIIITQAVSTALAVAFAKHLFSLKFSYSGTTSGVPLIGVVPFVF